MSRKRKRRKTKETKTSGGGRRAKTARANLRRKRRSTRKTRAPLLAAEDTPMTTVSTVPTAATEASPVRDMIITVTVTRVCTLHSTTLWKERQVGTTSRNSVFPAALMITGVTVDTRAVAGRTGSTIIMSRVDMRADTNRWDLLRSLCLWFAIWL
jgi:hypothetical protein